MTINITDKPEMNVVNVGDEITTDQLGAIQGNTNNPSSANPFATMADIGGSVNPFDQSLNTTDNPQFNTVSTDTLRSKALNGNINFLVYNDTGAGTYYTNYFNAYTNYLIFDSNAGGITFPDGTSQTTAYTGGGGGSGVVVNQVGTFSTNYNAVLGDRVILIDNGMTVELVNMHATYSPPDSSTGSMVTIVNQDATTTSSVWDAFSGVYNSSGTIGLTLAPRTAVTLCQGTNGYWYVV
jgi:hypothetical protein